MARSWQPRLQFPLRLLLGAVTVTCVLMWWHWTRPHERALLQSATGHRQIHVRDKSYLKFCFDKTVKDSLVTVLGDSRLTHWDHVLWLSATDAESTVSYGSDHALLLWNCDDGSIRKGFYDVTAAALAIDSQEICFVDEQGGFRVWELESDMIAEEGFDFPRDWKGELAMSPDGQHVVRFDRNGTAVIWNRYQDTTHNLTLEALRAAYAFTPDQRHILIGSPERIDQYELITGKLTDSFPALSTPDGSLTDTYVLVFSPDGKRLIISDADGNLYVYDWPGRTLSKQLTGEELLVHSAIFRDENTLIVAGYHVRQFSGWDKPNVRVRTLLNYRATALAIGHGSLIFAASNGRIDELHGDSTKRLVGGPRNDATTFAFSPDGNQIALAGRDGQITIRETATWRQVQSWKAHDSWIQTLLWPTGGGLLISQGEESLMAVWNVNAGKELRTIETMASIRPTLSRDGRLLLVYARDRTKGILVYEIATWRELASVPRKALRVRGNFLLSDDRKELFAGASQATVDRWSCEESRKIASFGGRTLDDVQLVLSAEGQQIFATDGGSVEAFDIATGTPLWTVKVHSTLVCDLSGHPSKPVLATGGKDGTVALVDSSGGKLLKTLRLAPTGGEILQVDFSPDGRLLAAAMSNGAVVVMREPWK